MSGPRLSPDVYEVEVKVPASLDRVRESLLAAGADRLGSVEQADTYYDAPHRSFAETDEALRIRVETSESSDAPDGATARLTYKGPRTDADSKIRREVETDVGDADDAAAILEALGFSPVETVRKGREHWRLDGYTVTLDRVDGLGEFVEVETHAREADVEAARKGARAVVERLGLEPADQVRDAYLSLLLD